MKSINDRKHVGTSRYKWKKTIAEWLASKQSAKIFCAERDLNESTFYYWRARFDPGYQPRNKMLPLRRTSPQAFMPVVVEHPKQPRATTGIKFYYPNGCFMVLEEGCDLRLFQTIFEATRTILCS